MLKVLGLSYFCGENLPGRWKVVFIAGKAERYFDCREGRKINFCCEGGEIIIEGWREEF